MRILDIKVMNGPKLTGLLGDISSIVDASQFLENLEDKPTNLIEGFATTGKHVSHHVFAQMQRGRRGLFLT
jgi:hypothetical protein